MYYLPCNGVLIGMGIINLNMNVRLGELSLIGCLLRFLQMSQLVPLYHQFLYHHCECNCHDTSILLSHGGRRVLCVQHAFVILIHWHDYLFILDIL